MAGREETIAAVLALWGTRKLTGNADIPWPALEEQLETDLTGSSAHARRVRFVTPEDETAAPPPQWLAAAAARGATRLGLLAAPRAGAAHPLPDHVLRAFAGAGDGVLLCAVGRDELLPYRSRTRRVRLQRRRGRTASYEFAGVGPVPGPLPEPDLAAERSRLDTALRDLEGFAREIDQPRWADRFREARDALAAGGASPWIEGLFGDGLLGKEAFGLLAASYKADVFGGMGAARTSALVADGLCRQTSPATAATCGVAIDVPSNLA